MDTQYVKNVAARTCELLKKSQLIGAEVPDYTECWNVLNALIAGELSLIETPVLSGLKESDEEVAIMQICINRWPKSVGKRVDQVREEMAVNQKAPEPIELSLVPD